MLFMPNCDRFFRRKSVSEIGLVAKREPLSLLSNVSSVDFAHQARGAFTRWQDLSRWRLSKLRVLSLTHSEVFVVPYQASTVRSPMQSQREIPSCHYFRYLATKALSPPTSSKTFPNAAPSRNICRPSFTAISRWVPNFQQFPDLGRQLRRHICICVDESTNLT